jgi:hypothetical protein
MMTRIQEMLLISKMSQSLDHLHDDELTRFSLRFMAYPKAAQFGVTNSEYDRLDKAAVLAQRARRAAMVKGSVAA